MMLAAWRILRHSQIWRKILAASASSRALSYLRISESVRPFVEGGGLNVARLENANLPGRAIVDEPDAAVGLEIVNRLVEIFERIHGFHIPVKSAKMAEKIGGDSMSEKTTAELFNEIKSDPDIENFIAANQSEFTGKFHEYLKRLLKERGLTVKFIADTLNLDRSYVHHIFSGSKKASRERLLAIVRVMGLDLPATQYLLRYGGFVKFGLEPRAGLVVEPQILFLAVRFGKKFFIAALDVAEIRPVTVNPAAVGRFVEVLADAVATVKIFQQA